MKKVTYNICSDLGFIGFVVIVEYPNNKQSNIFLFEEFEIMEGFKQLIQQSSLFRIFTKDILNLNIIKDLLSASISSFYSNDLNYKAIDLSGKTYEINKME